MRFVKDMANLKANLKSINQDLKDPDISDAEKKDLEQKKKDIMKEQKLGKLGKMVGIAAEFPNKSVGGGKLKDGKKTDFGMLSVKAGIDKNPKPTQADRIAGATMKDGARTKVRGVRIANKGYRKAKLS
jgi:hypothetical protein